MPTPNPSRTPIVVLLITFAGITCEDYDQSVYFTVLGEFLPFAAFHYSTCADLSRRRRAMARSPSSSSYDDNKQRRLDESPGVDIATHLVVAKSYETDNCDIVCLVVGTMEARDLLY